MKQLVESLKRLYLAGKISREKLENMCKNGMISKDDMAFILAES